MTTRNFLWTLVALVATGIVVAGCGGDDETGDAASAGGAAGTLEDPILDRPIDFELEPVGDAGLPATVTMGPADETSTTLEVVVETPEPTDPNSAHLHRGTCQTFDPAEPLERLGETTEGTTEDTVDLSALELLDGEFVVDVHESDVALAETVVSCGEVPDKDEVEVTAD